MKDVREALVLDMMNEVITCPVDSDNWQEIAEELKLRWNVSHASGALYGKHVAIRKRPKSGPMYHNYEGFKSIILMALVDADYKFLWIESACQQCLFLTS